MPVPSDTVIGNPGDCAIVFGALLILGAVVLILHVRERWRRKK